jgi:hypothetical protein
VEESACRRRPADRAGVRAAEHLRRRARDPGHGRDRPAARRAALQRVSAILDAGAISHGPAYLEDGRITVRFPDVEDQLRALDRVREQLGAGFVAALTLTPRTPAFLRAVGLKPMSLGLDLRGGVHFMYEVDMEAAIGQALDRYEADFRTLLRDARIRYKSVRRDGNVVLVTLESADDRSAARRVVADADRDLSISERQVGADFELVVRMSDDQVRERQDFAIDQNTITLRNRVNELGVSEPVVQRQGADRIVVQLPGMQDPAQAERVLGATATLEFRLVDEVNSPFEAAERGRAPLGSALYRDRYGQPVLLRARHHRHRRPADRRLGRLRRGHAGGVRQPRRPRRPQDGRDHPRQPEQAHGGGVHRAEARPGGARRRDPRGHAHRGARQSAWRPSAACSPTAS